MSQQLPVQTMLVSGPAGATICHYLTRRPQHTAAARVGGQQPAPGHPHTTCQHSLQLLSDENPDKLLISTHLSFALLTSIWLHPDVFLDNKRDPAHHNPAAARGVSISSSYSSGVESTVYLLPFSAEIIIYLNSEKLILPSLFLSTVLIISSTYNKQTNNNPLNCLQVPLK